MHCALQSACFRKLLASPRARLLILAAFVKARFRRPRVVQLACRGHPGGAAPVVLPNMGARLRRTALEQAYALGLGRTRSRRSGSGFRVLGFQPVCVRADGHVRTREDNLALRDRVRGGPAVAGGG